MRDTSAKSPAGSARTPRIASAPCSPTPIQGPVILEAADPAFRPASDPAAAQRQAIGLIGQDLPYLLVGANSATKRYAAAITAIAAMRFVQPPQRLVLLQRQGQHRRLAALARERGVAGRIVWLPRVSGDEVWLMQGAGALIQPSIYEDLAFPSPGRLRWCG